MLNRELEVTLNLAFKEARSKRHEFMTVEHLLLALLDNEAAATVLRACGANLDKLKHDLQEFIDSTTPLIPVHDEDRETQPTLGFQRVLQRAVFHVQSSGKREVTGANVLVAIFSEQESQAVFLLKQQSVARIDVVNYIAHGISKVPGHGDHSEGEQDMQDDEGGESSSSGNPLDAYASNLNELARQGRIDPLVGRELEVERVAQILARRRKNNPLLVGEAGVGKTAIAEGLAKRIVDNQVPDLLANSVVYSLMKFTEGAFKEWAYGIAEKEFGATLLDGGPWMQFKNPKTGKNVVVKDAIADAMLQQILLRPAEYDVIATLNLNGDYLSDALAAEVGGIGIAPGANLSDTVAMFEATHGTAPKYAGKDQVNPGSLILSAEMMLRHLGWTEAADLIIKGTNGAISAKTVTYDFERLMEGAKLVSSSGFGDALISHM